LSEDINRDIDFLFTFIIQLKIYRMEVKFRKAVRKDIGLILQFITELAIYERMEKEVVATEEDLAESLFGERPAAEVIFALAEGTEAGFVLFFHNYSTFLGKPGIYIEDLYVSPEYRGRGIGRQLLEHIAGLAVERSCGRVEWWVLNWNPARKFYEALGAKAMDEWTVYRLSGKELNKMAGREL
jgi:GNAT superfamily N-acetyltransferase